MERLASELRDAMGEASPPRDILLWFDPGRDFNRLLSGVTQHLGPEAEIFRHNRDASQVQLKLDLLRREASSSRTVVYLPEWTAADLSAGGPRGEQRPELWALADYRFKGLVWTGGGTGDRPISLLAWLKRQGVEPAFGASGPDLLAGGRESILAQYVEMHLNTDPTRWPRPLRADDVRERLAGDPTDAALLLIVSPRAAELEWGERTPEVLRGISHEYGVSAKSNSTADHASALVAGLALTDAWDAFGRRPDFPFAAVLPSSDNQRLRALQLLREHVLRRTDVSPRYHELVEALSGKWAALRPWSKALGGQPLGMRDLATARVTDMLDQLDLATRETRTKSAGLLRSSVDSWAGTHDQWIGPMKAVAMTTDLLDGIDRALDSYAAMQDASVLIEAYAAPDGWAAIDGAYIRLLATIEAEPMLAPLRILANHTYMEWVSNLNDRFTSLVEQGGVWPPRHTHLAPAPEWMASAKIRRAVIVTDALRLDVAMSVAERLSDADLDVGLSTLPTTTPFGMAALLPHGGPLAATISERGLSLRDGASKHDLATRTGRRAWLTESLSSAKQKVTFVELDQLLAGAKATTAELTVVFDYRLDDAGHGQASLPEEVDGHVNRLVRAVQRLHELGTGTVEVVTDHGFLHQPPDLVEALGKPPVAPAQVHHRAPRYAVIKPDAPVQSLIRMTSPLVPDLQLGFPRGIRTLEKPDEYLHGGISLQECVIGRIRSVRTIGPALLGIAVGVPSTQLATGTVAVTIEPESGQQMTFSPPPPRRVRLWVETALAESASEPLETEVHWDAPQQTFALYLREGQAIAAGSAFRLVMDDADTGERMHTEDLTMLVDWE